MGNSWVILLLKDQAIAEALATDHRLLSFSFAEDPAAAAPDLLDNRTLFVTDDATALTRNFGENSRELAGVVLTDPLLDPGDFGFEPLLVTFLPPGTPAAAIHAVLTATARRLERFMFLSDRLARDESEIRRHHDEQKHFLVELMSKNERLRRLEENSTDWIWELDQDLNFSYSSSRCQEILGVSPSELTGRGFSDFIPVESSEGKEREEVIKRLFGRQEKFSSREFVVRRKSDGGLVYLDTSGIPIFSSNGSFRGYLGVARDVSKKKQDSARLSRLCSIQKMVNSVLETVITDASYKDQLGHVLDVALSLSFPRMLPKGAVFTVENGSEVLKLQVHRGFSEEQLKVCSSVPFGTCVCGHAARDGILLAADCEDEIHEIKLASATPHSHYCVPVSSRGRILGVLNIYMAPGLQKDPDEEEFLNALANCLAVIIERHRAKEEKERLLDRMARSRRLDSVSRLAGGLAHDFNNLLTGISGYAMLTMLELEEGDKRRKNLEAIGESCRRAAQLVRQLATFGQQEKVALQELHLGGFIKNEEKKLRQVLGAGVSLKLESEPGLWMTAADINLLENILFNLAHNSREAMAGNGEFTLRCSNARLERDDAARLPGLEPGDYVLIEASDNGCGIDPSILDLVFDPFFSTSKDPGRGLGLATVYGAMKRLGGNIYAESSPGNGTTFRLYFPISGAAQQAGERGGGPAKVTARGEKILLLEDDEMVRFYLNKILVDLGYQVSPCSSGGEALALEDDFDLLLADVVLPDINGVEVSRELKARNPNLKVLFMSGFMDSAEKYDDELMPGRNFIGKPVMPAVLASRVRRILEGD